MRDGFIKNLGLGEGAPVIGSPFPWPHAQMPNELFASMSGMVFLKSNGASFSGTLYPKLALAYPGLKLADLRGEFIRGWDDGRGVDAGRTILSAQASSEIKDWAGANGDYPYRGTIGVSFGDGAGQGDAGWSIASNSGQVSVGVGTSTTKIRPRNVAYNYIVRAA